MVVVEPQYLVSFGGQYAYVAQSMLGQVCGIVTDVQSVEAHGLACGVVEFYPCAVVERGVYKHVYVGRLYLVDDERLGCRNRTFYGNLARSHGTALVSSESIHAGDALTQGGDLSAGIHSDYLSVVSPPLHALKGCIGGVNSSRKLYFLTLDKREGSARKADIRNRDNRAVMFKAKVIHHAPVTILVGITHDTYGQCTVNNLNLDAIIIHSLFEAISAAHHPIRIVIVGPPRGPRAPATVCIILGKVFRVYASNGRLAVVGIEAGRYRLRAASIPFIGHPIVSRTVVGLRRETILAVGYSDGLMNIERTVPKLPSIILATLARRIADIGPACCRIAIEIRVGHVCFSDINPLLGM